MRWSETPALDAQVLLAHALDKSRSWLLAHPEAQLSTNQLEKFEHLLAQLENGQPLPHVLGCWEFYGLEFELTPAVLIPRPETELLVDKALEWLHASPLCPGEGGPYVLDVGTGSGCIAVSLAVQCPGLHVTASDISFDALQVAWRNAQKHAVAERVRLVQADLLSSLKPGFGLICANLPYIPHNRLLSLAVYGREPALALDGGEDGLVTIRRFLQQARSALTGGCLLLEIDAMQGQAVRELAQEAFPGSKVEVYRDLGGRERLAKIEMSRRS